MNKFTLYFVLFETIKGNLKLQQKNINDNY